MSISCRRLRIWPRWCSIETRVLFVIYYGINKSQAQPIIVAHLHSAFRLFGLYLIGSVVYGVLLSDIGNNLVRALPGVGLILFMMSVFVWLSIRCAQGIVAAFNQAIPSPASG